MSDDYSRMEAIARAVATDLNDAADTFAKSFRCTYDPQPEVQLKDLGTAVATVRDIDERSIGVACRSLTEYEYDVEINVWQRVDSDTSLLASRLKKLGEQIADYFRFIPATQQQWPRGVAERYKRVDTIQLWDDADIDQRSLMKVRIVIVFQGWR